MRDKVHGPEQGSTEGSDRATGEDRRIRLIEEALWVERQALEAWQKARLARFRAQGD